MQGTALLVKRELSKLERYQEHLPAFLALQEPLAISLMQLLAVSVLQTTSQKQCN